MEDAEEYCIEEDVQNDDEDDEEEKKKRPIIKNAMDLQRLKLEKLMKHPEKQVMIPEIPREKDFMQSVPTFVRNVMGSSAGAGSGEFHVYRHLRRKEYARQKYIQAKSIREQLDDDYRQKLEQNRKDAEEKTAKRRAKRLKKKQKMKLKGRKRKKTGESEELNNDEDASASSAEESNNEEKAEDERKPSPTLQNQETENENTPLKKQEINENLNEDQHKKIEDQNDDDDEKVIPSNGNDVNLSKDIGEKAEETEVISSAEKKTESSTKGIERSEKADVPVAAEAVEKQ